MKPFRNILEKGYRVTQYILQNHQKIMQPKHSKDGHDFTGDERLCIFEIASDRPGNEMAVKYVKQSECLTDGLNQHQDFARVNVFWKVFSFQTNFMYFPVV